jgi:hypothetical protein
MKSAFACTIAALTAVSFAASASIAVASGFTGRWPVTVSGARAGNGDYCVTLTDDGSYGWPHSGAASINTGLNGATQTGIFQLIGHTVVISIDNPGLTENAGTVYATRADKGALTDGAFSEMYGGESVNSGAITFGVKGHC